MNTIDISYEKDSFRKLAPARYVRGYLDKVLAELSLNNVEFSVSFIDEDHMHDMNKEFRNIDDSTDILSFAAEDEEDGFTFISAGRRKRVLGDILICPQVLSRNAASFGVTENEELRRLLIHGVLHLSGDNHSTNDPSEPMLIRQEAVLKKLGE
ncbi:MAG: rRNA maturation RNase YbeY [Spirochaetales bacterium]|nr:rRNA maturation RNase YbeY [Spirochaetales bacterium]MBQ5364752.1 rRNA maturation RNase YbeY [Spirochaetales bacterium]